MKITDALTRLLADQAALIELRGALVKLIGEQLVEGILRGEPEPAKEAILRINVDRLEIDGVTALSTIVHYVKDHYDGS